MNLGSTNTLGTSRCTIGCVRVGGALRRAGRKTARTAMAIAFLSALLVIAVMPTQAQRLTPLHGFGGADGANPEAELIRDVQGNFYGTTHVGGAYGYGTVFMLSPSGVETVLHSFTGGADGSHPLGGLLRDAQGNLYGTTDEGGAYGGGAIFMLSPSGVETVLHSFNGGDGAYPGASLVQDTQGNLYGTASEGGAYSAGTIFKVTLSGTYSVLYNFTGGVDGGFPTDTLILDAQGNLYGTAFEGGTYGWGVVFTLSPSGVEKVLYSFKAGVDGAYPYGGLVRDAQGNLYGTTQNGGAYGLGTVFVFNASGSLKVLHSFAGTSRKDGATPYAGLIQSSIGNLYGTTYYGGAHNYGTVFMFSPSSGYTLLYSFTAGADGAGLIGRLLRDSEGSLYGTTQWYGANGGGTVFKLMP